MGKKKTNGKRSTGTKPQTNVLKPVLALIAILALIGLAFYFGTRYNNLKNRNAGQSQPTAMPNNPGNAGTASGDKTPAPSEEPAQKQNVTLTLYFPNVNGDSVVPEQRLVEINKGEILEEVIFRQLQKGSLSSDTGTIIPKGTKLLSAGTKEGICTLDLSAEFVDNNPGGTAFEAALINSIVNSLTELSHVKKVQFLIDGKKREVYTHMTFSEPFERNESFIRKSDSTSEAIEEKLRELGENTLKALRDRDMEWLSSIVHPDKKLRFSPYTYVNPDKSLAFTADEIKTLMKSDKVYTWGEYDGSGEPIQFTFKEYMNVFVYDQDFLNAEEVGYNQFIGQGNTLNNIFEAYPDGKMIEYHFPGFDPQYMGMDWESLKLVFEEKDGTWYLVCIVHDQWTI
ncbi:MAG: GerMN domain-containing protein [Thermoclostridium sp.]|nr:GerMN domain-containing protein [Thermoclostridium sp.]